MLVIIQCKVFCPPVSRQNINITTKRAIILPAVANESETWLITLMNKHWLRVFESRVLSKIFSPNRDEVRNRGVEKTT
jgi:hypothetical protein